MKVVQVPLSAVSPEALAGLVGEFVTRDGTDYGTQERSVESKTLSVRRQLERGEVVIVFDAESETFNIVPKDGL